MSLQLVHPQADLAPVFAALGLQPSHLHRCGDARHGADGTPRRGHYRCSAGTALLSMPCGTNGHPPESLDACLSRALKALSAHAALLQACVDQGGRARVAVRLGDGAGPTWMPPASLARLLESLGLDLAIDVDDSMSAPVCRRPTA